MGNAEPLYFLTMITVLVVVLGMAIWQTVQKRRAARVETQTDSTSRPEPTSGS